MIGMMRTTSMISMQCVKNRIYKIVARVNAHARARASRYTKPVRSSGAGRLTLGAGRSRSAAVLGRSAPRCLAGPVAPAIWCPAPRCWPLPPVPAEPPPAIWLWCRPCCENWSSRYTYCGSSRSFYPPILRVFGAQNGSPRRQTAWVIANRFDSRCRSLGYDPDSTTTASTTTTATAPTAPPTSESTAYDKTTKPPISTPR